MYKGYSLQKLIMTFFIQRKFSLFASHSNPFVKQKYCFFKNEQENANKFRCHKSNCPTGTLYAQVVFTKELKCKNSPSNSGRVY